MLFEKPHHSKPLFLWVTLVASTLLLLAVVYVQVRPHTINMTATDAVTDADRTYAQQVRAQLDPLLSTFASSSASVDAKKKQTTTVLNTILALSVPERMQTIHLSIVLQLNQLQNATDAGQAATADARLETLRSIVQALPYE